MGNCGAILCVPKGLAWGVRCRLGQVLLREVVEIVLAWIHLFYSLSCATHVNALMSYVEMGQQLLRCNVWKKGKEALLF